MTDNSEQIEYWNGSAGENWVETYPVIDRLLEPLSAVAIGHADAGLAKRSLMLVVAAAVPAYNSAATARRFRGSIFLRPWWQRHAAERHSCRM